MWNKKCLDIVNFLKGKKIKKLQDKLKQLRAQSIKIYEDLGEIRENVVQF